MGSSSAGEGGRSAGGQGAVVRGHKPQRRRLAWQPGRIMAEPEAARAEDATAEEPAERPKEEQEAAEQPPASLAEPDDPAEAEATPQEVDMPSAGSDNVVVAVRVRPFNEREKGRNAQLVVDMPDGQVTELRSASLPLAPFYCNHHLLYFCNASYAAKLMIDKSALERMFESLISNKHLFVITLVMLPSML